MKSQVRRNAEKDQNYNPYCMRCRGLVRMKKVAAFFWRCSDPRCEAQCDEREPYMIRFTETTYPYGKDQPSVLNGPFIIRGNAIAIYRVMCYLGANLNVTAHILYADDTPANMEEFHEDISRGNLDGVPLAEFLATANRAAGK